MSRLTGDRMEPSMSKWQLYDELIEGVPSDLKASEVLVCRNRTMVTCEIGSGMAMTMDSGAYPSQIIGSPVGKSLRDLAALIKSWNFVDASVGLAAMNAYYNSEKQVTELKARISQMYPDNRNQTEDAFLYYQPMVEGKKVATIGHFAYLDRRFAPICDLSILERAQEKGDYPDSACEYILPEQDFVFITATTLINKTLPRLLEICKGEGKKPQVILCGPSTVMSPTLFAHGVDDLAGFMVLEPEVCRQFISFDNASVFASGKMIRALKPEGMN